MFIRKTYLIKFSCVYRLTYSHNKIIFEEETKMEEKRYFYDWYDDSKKHKRKISLALIVLSFFIVIVGMFVYGDFSVFKYPEETFQEMEQAYIPYVHEGVGIDIIGLEGAVHGLKNPIISDENIEFTYGYTTCAITVTLDKNYNTLFVDRSAQTEQEYLRAVIITNIASFVLYVVVLTLALHAIYIVVMNVICLFSFIHKFIDKKLSKNKKIGR